MSDTLVRTAAPTDAAAVRSLVTRALLTAGFPAPNPELDPDLVDIQHYHGPGRRLWVAERDGTVVGCAAIEVDLLSGTAVLRRLAGGLLELLIDEALAFARAEGVQFVETVLPPGLPGTQEALVRSGFASDARSNDMLLRKELR